ncbi:peptidoglycan-binding protein [Streptomyces sp. NPDC102364]|uniref:peptidoglycan-binding protein n=1 Tax=Streptomyces sp. NPDC102364 TaxID=3366161 RepID=UPI00380D0D38
MKLVTRTQLGWPASAAPTQASAKGVKVHYEGAPVSTRLLTDHDACITEWKSIRRSHLANKTENYSDVAYNYAACPHGYLFEGRGLHKRTGANGNQALNQAHYAIVGLVGSSGLTEPTDAMLGAIRDGIELLRRNGAGNEIKGHRDGYATTCPGGPLYAWVQKGAPRPGGTSSTDEPSDGSSPSGSTYTVKAGDTLSGIGTKTGVKWQTIAELNNIKTPYTIKPGQVLKLKAPTTAAPKFPGIQYFKPGANNKYVEQLGKQLVKKGYGGHYTVGPGPRWSEADRKNVQAFQRTQGWAGTDADGYPGPETWRRLFS